MNLTGSEKLRSLSVADYLAGEIDALIALPTINAKLPLAAIYAEVKFIAEPEELYGKENG